MNTKKKVYEALSKTTKKVNLSLAIELDNTYQSLKKDIDKFKTDATRLDSVAKEIIEYRKGIENLQDELKGQFTDINNLLSSIQSFQYELMATIGEAQYRTQELGVSMKDLFPDFEDANRLVDWSFEQFLSDDVYSELSDMNLI